MSDAALQPTPQTAAPTPLTLKIAGMTCAACQIHVQRALQAVPGVTSANVNLMAHTAQVLSAGPVDTDALTSAVKNAGYKASLPTASMPGMPGMADGQSQWMDMEGPRLGLRALAALIAGAFAMLLSMPLMMNATSSDPLLNAITRWLAPVMPSTLMSLPAQPLRWTLAALALAVMLFAAPEIYTAAWQAARHRATNMNTLIALGTLAAFASSLAATLAPAYFARHGMGSDVYFEAVIFILAFLLVGRWLEATARARATQALQGFAQLESSEARLLTIPPSLNPQILSPLTSTDPPSTERVPHVSTLRHGSDADRIDYSSLPETLLPLSAIEPNDLVRVLPGDRIPLDGIILDGRSSIDESMLTGEPLPVTREPGATVRGGTLNLDGALVVRATATGADSTLAQMQRLLSQAQSSRAPMQRLADQASAIFVPTVLALAALTFAAWAVALNTGQHHEGFARPLAISIAVLIIACPCAMGLAVPAAITVALGRAAQLGLLIKGGEALERLATVDTMALDKTGTLTLGQPTITQFTIAPTATRGSGSGTGAGAGAGAGAPPLSAAERVDSEMWDGSASPPTFSRETLLAYAAAAERLTTHPLARAVVAFAESTPNLPAAPTITDFKVLPGIGLTCTVDAHQLSIGNTSVLNGQPAPPDAPPRATPLYLVLDGHLEAAFYASDELRPAAAEALTELRALHVTPLLLTGDIAASAAPIAEAAGIAANDVRAGLLPDGKLAAIKALQQQGHRVAMVGDGINDAAALAQSDAGLAMAAGADLAREAGDILLLHTDLHLLPTSIRIARRTVHIMRQNLVWAAGYNLIGIPLAAGVLYPHFHILLSPILASVAMALSSVSVLANSLRLRRL
jgi:Cu+-exporting ATPase